MAYSSYCRKKIKENCPEIPYFSNPGMVYKDDALGVKPGQPNSADNVTAIKRNKRLVASYRPRADAAASKSGNKAAISVPTTSKPRKVGGIILESSANQNNRQGKGKERVIKW